VARTTAPSVPKQASGLRYNDLMTAVLYGDVDGVNELLKLGKWADKPDSRGTTPLMMAAERGDVRTAEALLRGGANARRALPLAEERRDDQMLLLLKRYSR
jgi:ankyrin repeat protein